MSLTQASNYGIPAAPCCHEKTQRRWWLCFKWSFKDSSFGPCVPFYWTLYYQDFYPNDPKLLLTIFVPPATKVRTAVAHISICSESLLIPFVDLFLKPIQNNTLLGWHQTSFIFIFLLSSLLLFIDWHRAEHCEACSVSSLAPVQPSCIHTAVASLVLQFVQLYNIYHSAPLIHTISNNRHTVVCIFVLSYWGKLPSPTFPKLSLKDMFSFQTSVFFVSLQFSLWENILHENIPQLHTEKNTLTMCTYKTKSAFISLAGYCWPTICASSASTYGFDS